MRYDDFDDSPMLAVSNQINALELVWPLPLLIIGILGFLNPIAVGVALVMAFLPWLARFFTFGHITRPAYLTGPMLLFAASGFIGVWASYQPALSWPLLLTILGSMNLFFAIVNANLPPQWLVSGVVIIATGLAIYFALQYSYFGYTNQIQMIHQFGETIGSILPNLAYFVPYINAVTVFLSGPLLLCVVLVWRARQEQYAAWELSLVLMGYAILLTQSRGGWLSLLIVGTLWLVLSVTTGWQFILISLATAGGLVGLLWGLWLLAPTWLMTAFEAGLDRWLLFQNSLNLWGDYPFTGIGLGDTFAFVYSEYQLLIPYAFLTNTHNLFLAVALGQGIIGLLALIWLLLAFYWFVFRVERIGLSKRALMLFRGAWLGVTANLIHGMVEGTQFSDSRWTMPMLFVLFGLTITIGRPAIMWAEETTEDKTLPPIFYRRDPFLVALIVILLMVSLFFWSTLAGAWYANLGAVYQTKADLNPDIDRVTEEILLADAVHYFRQALAIDPQQSVAHRRLGQLALERREFETAVTHLEAAYPQEPTNQATLKALGLAYTWTGELEKAVALLRRLNNQAEIIEELGNWRNWWRSQEQTDLSDNAEAVRQQLTIN